MSVEFGRRVTRKLNTANRKRVREVIEMRQRSLQPPHAIPYHPKLICDVCGDRASNLIGSSRLCATCKCNSEVVA